MALYVAYALAYALMTMRRGDVLHHVQPGGGAFGDPFERDPARVLEAVRNEKVSIEAARRE